MKIFEELFYKLNSGKNSKWKYYLKSAIKNCIPRKYYSSRLEKLLNTIPNRSDKDYIKYRVDYYNKLTIPFLFESGESTIIKLNDSKNIAGSMYYYDSQEVLKYFDEKLNWIPLFGDITHIPNSPSIVKSRPINGNNENSVLLKLNKIRHFIFLKDKIPFEKKENRVIFRGKIINKENRIHFMEKFYGNDFFDIGEIGKKI